MRSARPILPGRLYMGSSPAKWKPREKRDEWLRENVHLVVSLCNRDPETEGIVEETWHHPVVDSHTTIDPEITERVVPYVVGKLLVGKRVAVTCLVGRSRSGITCALVLRELYNLTGDDALRLLRERRPGAVKREGPEAWLRGLPRPRPGEAVGSRE